ncbi:MAG: TRAP transporter small permease subunit [Pseudomonadota bacterium]
MILVLIAALLCLPLLAGLIPPLRPVVTSLADFADRVNGAVGALTSWLSLFMVLTVFVIVILRYVYGVGFIWMQESVVYMHGFLFMLAAGFTLRQNGHVRVDVFYGSASPARRALVDVVGTYLFLFPVCLVILYASYPYVASSWAVFEKSRETSGIPGVFLLKTALLVLPVLLMAQGFALAARSLATLRGDTQHVDLAKAG